MSAPISWLRLERLALGEVEASERHALEVHLSECPGCAAVFAEVQTDRVSLPSLAAPAPRRWWAGWQVLALAAAATGGVVVLVPDVEETGVKGDALALALVARAPDGRVTLGDEFSPEDALKVQVTCAAPGRFDVDVAVVQDGRVDFPLPPATVECGNAVALPGAFRLTATTTASVCLFAGDPPPRGSVRVDRRGAAAGASLCLTVRARDD